MFVPEETAKVKKRFGGLDEQGSDLLTVSGGKRQLTGADVQSIRAGSGRAKSKTEKAKKKKRSNGKR